MPDAAEEVSVNDEVRQFRFERPSGATTVLLIRHGESAPAVPNEQFPMIDGHGDPDLHPDGRIQAEKVGERLAGEPISAIYASNLRRTSLTAGPLAERLGLDIQIEPDLREVFLGDWEGGEYRIRVAGGDPLVQRMFEEQRWDVIPGAEPATQFEQRVTRALDSIARGHPDETVAVFTHGGVIGQALATATGSRPFSFVGADNASITVMVSWGDRWVVRGYNDVGHLRTSELPLSRA